MIMNEALLSRQQEPLSPSSFPSPVLNYLYAGHFLARWGARMWEFSVGLYMINVWPDTLLLAAAYGVVESASTAVFGPLVGRWVDQLSYVKVVQIWLLIQNVSFIVAGGAVVALLVCSNLKFTNFAAFITLVTLTNVSGAVGVLSTLAGTILIEREWVVVISEGHAPTVLTETNSVMRRIDLICKLCAPVVSGFIISFISMKASALTLALWNIFSVCLQYWLFMSVYTGIPALSESSQKRLSAIDLAETPSTCEENQGLISSDDNASQISTSSSSCWQRKIVDRISNIPYVRAWRIYLNQDVLLPGLALALLYFTVLGFGTLMTAALEWEGIPAYVIGIARGVSAAIGIAATFLYPILQSYISTPRTGLWSIWFQWSCLLVCVASTWVPNNKLISAYMLMGGVAVSRLGLWMFDLSVIQQMQDQVPESHRCVVGGVQNSLQSVLDMLTYVMAIIISNPQDFWKLTTLSFFLVSLAASLYSLHIYRVRKHLFHINRLFLLVRRLFLCY